jgi:hypothetical protein
MEMFRERCIWQASLIFDWSIRYYSLVVGLKRICGCFLSCGGWTLFMRKTFFNSINFTKSWIIQWKINIEDSGIEQNNKLHFLDNRPSLFKCYWAQLLVILLYILFCNCLAILGSYWLRIKNYFYTSYDSSIS